METKQPSYLRNNHQSWFSLKLSCRILIFILILIKFEIPSVSAQPCDPNVAFQPLPDYIVGVLRLTSTSVHIQWSNPDIIMRKHPDYYCVVYNSESFIFLPPWGQFGNRTFQFEITHLTPDIFYNIVVKPCVKNDCNFARSVTRRLHT